MPGVFRSPSYAVCRLLAHHGMPSEVCRCATVRRGAFVRCYRPMCRREWFCGRAEVADMCRSMFVGFGRLHDRHRRAPWRGRWFVRDGVCGKRGRLRYALRTAFPVSSAGAGGGAYGKWSGGCGGMRSIPNYSKTCCSVRIAVRDEVVRKTMRFAGRVRCRTGCAGILPSRRAARQGSQPMRSSPRCASRQAVSPA